MLYVLQFKAQCVFPSTDGKSNSAAAAALPPRCRLSTHCATVAPPLSPSCRRHRPAAAITAAAANAPLPLPMSKPSPCFHRRRCRFHCHRFPRRCHRHYYLIVDCCLSHCHRCRCWSLNCQCGAAAASATATTAAAATTTAAPAKLTLPRCRRAATALSATVSLPPCCL